MRFHQFTILLLLLMPPGLGDTVGVLCGLDAPIFNGSPVDDGEEKDESDFDEDSLTCDKTLAANVCCQLARTWIELGSDSYRSGKFNPETARPPPCG